MDAKRMRQLESGAIPSGIVDGERVEIRGPDGKSAWLITKGRRVDTVARSKVSDVRDRWDAMRFWEAAGDDHFYGPWKGGAKGSGGRPDAKPGRDTATARTEAQGEGQHADWDVQEGQARAYVRHEMTSHGVFPSGEPNTLAEFDSPNWDGPGRMFVYRGDEGSPVAYVRMGRETVNGANGPAKIDAVYVFPSARGKGVGTKMYDMIQDTTTTNLYNIIGQSQDFTTAGKAFAASWLRHRIEVEG